MHKAGDSIKCDTARDLFMNWTNAPANDKTARWLEYSKHCRECDVCNDNERRVNTKFLHSN